MTMQQLDPRLHAYRPDLADARLQGKIIHQGGWAMPQPKRITLPVVDQHGAPTEDSAVVNQLLSGEPVAVFAEDTSSGWAWVQSLRDDYVGYVPTHALGEDFTPSHYIQVPSTLLLAAPSVKAKTYNVLPMFTETLVLSYKKGFAETPLGWVPEKHLRPTDDYPTLTIPALIQLAKQYLGSPYIWGGKTRLGLDCSGLIQLIFHHFACPLPRDTDQQQESDLLFTTTTTAQAGDLIFWSGHVGILLDSHTLLHANAYAMRTTHEPFDVVAARIQQTEGHSFTRKRWIGA